jgi:foldase protein PrsA
MARLICAGATLLVIVAGLIGCGAAGGEQTRVVARVGDSSITTTALSHWMRVLAPQHIVPQPPLYSACVARLKQLARGAATGRLEDQCRNQRRALTAQALGLLISTDWLTGEAALRGVGVSKGEIERRLEQGRRSFPNGEAEFQESLAAVAHTRADLELEVEAELAREKIRQSLTGAEPRIGEAQLARYYARHIQSYRVSERRHIYIAENFPSRAAAMRLIREVAHGRSLADVSLSETFPRSEIAETFGEKRTILEAIFAAKPHVVAKPVELNHLFLVFEVTRVAPAHLQSFASVRGAIAQHLLREQQRRTLAGFVAAWRRRWTARTDCSAGYVVQKCRQYRGPVVPEDPLELK